MIPEQAIQESKAQSKKEEEALKKIVSNIQSDPDATATEKRLASALVALKNS